MDWSNSASRLHERLPELERQILKFGDFFPLSLLPPGLFGEVHSGIACLASVKRDLEFLTETLRLASNPNMNCQQALVRYRSIRLTQKIYVLVHICRTCLGQTKHDLPYQMEQIGTHAQWLHHTQIRHAQLTAQKVSMSKTLQSMRAYEDRTAISCIEKEIQDIEKQLAQLSV